MMITNEQTGKVTLSCRISPTEKLLIAEKAQSLGLTLCQYTEALVLQNHRDFMAQSSTPVNPKPTSLDEVFEDKKLQALYQPTMQILKERYPEFSEAQLLIAALRHAMENHRVFIQKDLKVFLRRVNSNYYDSLTPKNNSTNDN
jgi:hypothetical protein